MPRSDALYESIIHTCRYIRNSLSCFYVSSPMYVCTLYSNQTKPNCFGANYLNIFYTYLPSTTYLHLLTMHPSLLSSALSWSVICGLNWVACRFGQLLFGSAMGFLTKYFVNIIIGRWLWFCCVAMDRSTTH